MKSTKEQIVAYLTANNIDFNANAKKEDLLALIK